MCEFMGGVYYFTRDCSEKSEGTATTATGCGYGSPHFLLRIVHIYIYIYVTVLVGTRYAHVQGI